MYHFDSLNMHSPSKIKKHLCSYLSHKVVDSEFSYQEKSALSDSFQAKMVYQTIPIGSSKGIPKQQNSTDCGVFTLKYMQEFILKVIHGGVEITRKNFQNYNFRFGNFNARVYRNNMAREIEEKTPQYKNALQRARTEDPDWKDRLSDDDGLEEIVLVHHRQQKANAVWLGRELLHHLLAMYIIETGQRVRVEIAVEKDL